MPCVGVPFIKQRVFTIKAIIMDKPAVYRIKARGAIPERCYDRLGGLQVTAKKFR